MSFESLHSQEQDLPSIKEDYRIKFYEMYHLEAEEYDQEFAKKYDEDLNTTLIFASLFISLMH